MLSYRGREGYWAWLLHRVSGVAIILFLFLHVLDTCLVGFGPNAYETFVSIYRVPFFRVLEVALSVAVLYHGINALRILVTAFLQPPTPIPHHLWYAVY